MNRSLMLLALCASGCIAINPDSDDDTRIELDDAGVAQTDASIGGDEDGAVDPDAETAESDAAEPQEPDAAIAIDPDAAIAPDPDAAVPVLAPADGEGCSSARECSGNFCIDEWPEGYCTTVGCQTFEDCASPDGQDNRCLQQGGNDNFCVRICRADAECREGYNCQFLGGGVGACLPGAGPSEPVEGGPLLDEAAIEAHPFGIQCKGPDSGNNFTFEFDINADTTAYMFTPFSRDGGQMAPSTLEGDAGTINFRGANAFQLATAQLFGSTAPIIVPAHSGIQNQLAPGRHVFSLQSADDSVCAYLLQENTPGTVIDLNIYLVGLGVTPELAALNPDLAAVFDTVQEIYSEAGIRVGRLRYFTLGAEADQQFSILRSQNAVGQLLELTEQPGPSADDALSLNVMLVQGFAIPDAAGVLGISMGLPGPAGLHGTPLSGVVFTSEYIGQRFRDGGGSVVEGNAYTGAVMAHEIGHYLGLFHTSEQDGRSQDPYDDTPRCQNFNNPLSCPDINNLMFPLARGDAADLSPRQISVIQNNPLTKE